MPFVRPRTLALALAAAACSVPASEPRTPVVTAAADPAPQAPPLPAHDFWVQGDAACPDGGELVGEPGYLVVACEKDGVRHGPWAMFGANGKVEQIRIAVRGVDIGPEQTFYPSGARWEVSTLVAFSRTGPFTRWHENGVKSVEGAYLDGVVEGLIRAWDDRGREIGTFTVTQGTGRLFKWHPNGQTASEVEYVKGKAQGPYTAWNERGQRIVSGTYVDGERHGDWFQYGADGRVTWHETYVNGLEVASVPYQAGAPLAPPASPGACASEAGFAAEYQRQLQRPLADAKACMIRSPYFPSAVIAGALDRGECTGWQLFLDCTLKGPSESALILERAGWNQASAENRAVLARNYVSGIVRSSSPTSAAATADGGVIVKILPSTSRVLRAEHFFQGYEQFPRAVDSYRFSPAGNVVRVEHGPDPGGLPALPDRTFWTLGDAACPGGAVLARTATQVRCKRGDQAHGPFAELDANGQLVQLGTYVHGDLRGAHAHFYPDGHKRMECIRSGVAVEPCVRWHANGQRAGEGTFRIGVPEDAEAWDDHGRPLGRVTLRNGTGRVIEWHPNGQKAEEYALVNGLIEGVHTEWHANGHKRSEGTLAQDTPQGTWRYFDETGALARVDTYADGAVATSLYHHAGKPLAPAPRVTACATHAGLVAAYEQQRKKSYAEAAPCSTRAIHFPGVVAIGERGVQGCTAVGAMIDCRFRPAVDPRAVLERAGWRRAPAPIRQAIARHYVEELGPKLREGAPRVSTDKAGTISVATTTWRHAPTAGAPAEKIERTFRFAADGSVRVSDAPAAP